jgi:Ca2+:H+ antiporter
MRPSIFWLLIFLPVTVVLAHVASAPRPAVFACAALAIVPVAALIVRSTEQLARHTGDAAGGLLNATFGNTPELIISLTALRAGYVDMVRAAIVGGILANLLLALGSAFLLGGARHHEQKYNPVAARMNGTMMLLAAVSMMVPSAFSTNYGAAAGTSQEQLLNVGIACVLLLAYVLYLIFSLGTHHGSFASVDTGHTLGHTGKPWTVLRAGVSLLAASVLAAWMSEILVGAAAETGRALGMSQMFMGIVFLAVVGASAEVGSVIALARKNHMDLSVGIAMGSSMQIALFVAPVLVLASQFIGPQPLDLSFSRVEAGALFLGVFIGAIVSGDGQSNWFKGVQLMTIYVIFALLFYFVPAGPG